MTNDQGWASMASSKLIICQRWIVEAEFGVGRFSRNTRTGIVAPSVQLLAARRRLQIFDDDGSY
jgi:hypothetical protein